MPAPRQPGRIIEAVPLVLIVGAVLATPFVLARWGAAPYVAVGLLVGACAGLIVVVILRNWSPLVGPLFFYDLVRLARRGRGTALRFVYGAALLLALGFIYNRHFPGTDLLSLSGTGQWVSLREQAAFAQAFATTLLLAQNVAVLVLTPAYLAGAVAEEKEKKTLPLLFTTALTSREIIVGKMLGRLAHIGGVLLVALPVLSLAQLWGGVDLAVILAGCAVTALTLLSVGALSLFFSTTANTVLSALVGAYAASAALGLGCLCQGGGYAFSPISFVMELDRRMTQGAEVSAVVGPPTAPAPDSGDVALQMVSYYAVVHGGIAVIVVLGTIALLRPNDRPAGLRPAEGPVERPADGDQLPRMPPQPVGLYSSPPIGDDAMFWKEVLYGTGPHAPRFREELAMPLAVTMIVSGVVWGVIGLAWLSDPYGGETTRTSVLLANVFNLMIRLSTVILLTLVCAAVAFRAVGAVVRERARRTLDGFANPPVVAPGDPPCQVAGLRPAGALLSLPRGRRLAPRHLHRRRPPAGAAATGPDHRGASCLPDQPRAVRVAGDPQHTLGLLHHGPFAARLLLRRPAGLVLFQGAAVQRPRRSFRGLLPGRAEPVARLVDPDVSLGRGTAGRRAAMGGSAGPGRGPRDVCRSGGRAVATGGPPVPMPTRYGRVAPEPGPLHEPRRCRRIRRPWDRCRFRSRLRPVAP
jgi:ABC-type transport system involved in multi-copper enzyme maturation permease subunit